MADRSSVYIPIVKLNSDQHTLLEVYAERQFNSTSILDAKALDKQWNPIAAPLREAGLYNAGLNAVNLLRKLKLKPSRWSIYQRFIHYAWLDQLRLYASHCAFDNCEGESVQLGMAIVLLLNATGSKIRHTLATGALSTRHYEDYDVIVEPVSRVPEKLTTIITEREAQFLPDEKLYCFTPTHYKSEQGLLPVSDLPQVKRLRELDILVTPISRLSEAAAILHGQQTRLLVQDYLINFFLAMMLSFLMVLVAYRCWLFYPINVEILKGKHHNEPFLVCTSNDNSTVRYFDFERDGEMLVFPLFTATDKVYNSGIGWKIRADATPFTQQYYVGLIHLGEQTGYKLIRNYPNSNQTIVLAAGQEFSWYWPMQESQTVVQDNVLMIVLSRQPIATETVNSAFFKQFSLSSKNQSLNIIAARDYLLEQFPGAYSFIYHSKIGDSPCLK